MKHDKDGENIKYTKTKNISTRIKQNIQGFTNNKMNVNEIQENMEQVVNKACHKIELNEFIRPYLLS